MSSTEQFVVLVSSSQREARFWESMLPGLQNYSGFSKCYHFHHILVYSMLPPHGHGSFLHRLLQRNQWQTEVLTKVLQRTPFWDDHPDHDPELILVGFKHGCRLIQDFLLRSLNKDNDVRRIRRVRQTIFLTPLRSSRIAWIVCVIFVVTLLSIPLYLLWPSEALLVGIASAIVAAFTVVTAGLSIAASPSTLALLGMEAEWFLGARIHKEFKERIEHGSRRKLGTWPIPSQELCLSKERYADPKVVQNIAEAILDADGHPNVYEVDIFECTLAVKPIQTKDLPQEVRNNLSTKQKYTSEATYVSHIHFSGKDRTGNEEIRSTYGELVPWELRQRTHGYLEIQGNYPNNLATSEENFTKNNTYIYRFRPKPHLDRFLSATIYGGYEANNRNIHVHLRADTNFQLIRITLDLSGYTHQNWIIKEPKVLFFHNLVPSAQISSQPGSLERDLEDLDCSCFSGDYRRLGLEIQVNPISYGVFRWEKLDVRNGGIIVCEFDILPR